MKLESADEIISRISQAREKTPGGIVATDGDGTLWSGDIGEEQFLAFLDSGEVSADGHLVMVREAERFAIDASGDARTVGRRLYDAYLSGAYPEEPACELMAYCFAGKTRAEVCAFAAKVIQASNLASRLHPELQVVLRWVRKENIDLYLVSASPIDVVRAAAAVAGIDVENVIASRPRFKHEVMLPDVERPIPYGPGKALHLGAHTLDRPLYAAFGDNAFDLVMLREAQVAVAVRPKQRLRDRMAEVPGLVELRR